MADGGSAAARAAVSLASPAIPEVDMQHTALLLLLLLPVLAACSSSGTENSTSSAPKRKRQSVVCGPLPRRRRPPTCRVRSSGRPGSASRWATPRRPRAPRLSRPSWAATSTATSGPRTATARPRWCWVPPASVERTLAALAHLGRGASRSASDTDVTADAVDVASRIATQRRSVERVRVLLGQAERSPTSRGSRASSPAGEPRWSPCRTGRRRSPARWSWPR